MEPESPEEERILKNLHSAYHKIREHGHAAHLTLEEKLAVRYALEDVGGLYLFAGTSAGFDVQGDEDVVLMQKLGRQARTEAGALGVYVMSK